MLSSYNAPAMPEKSLPDMECEIFLGPFRMRCILCVSSEAHC